MALTLPALGMFGGSRHRYPLLENLLQPPRRPPPRQAALGAELGEGGVGLRSQCCVSQSPRDPWLESGRGKVAR